MTSANLNNDIPGTVIHAISASSLVAGAEVTAQSSFDSLKLDSLEKLSIAMDLEEKYGIFMPDEEIEKFNCVSDVSQYIQAALTQI